MRWNKRHPDERKRIVKNTFALLERIKAKVEIGDATAIDLDRFWGQATMLADRLRFAPNSTKERLARITREVETWEAWESD